MDVALIRLHSPGRLTARPAELAECEPCWRRASAPGAALNVLPSCGHSFLAWTKVTGVPQTSVDVMLAVALSDAIYSARVLSASLSLAVSPALDTCSAPAQDYMLQVFCHMAGSQQALVL